MEKEFVETQLSLQKKADFEILKMKPDDYEREDLKIFNIMKESVQTKYRLGITLLFNVFRNLVILSFSVIFMLFCIFLYFFY